jgi:hypothetical protein
VSRDFLEPVDPGNAQHASLLIDRELVAVLCVDLFSIKEPDDEHGAVLSSEFGLGWIVRLGRYRISVHCGAAA